MSYTVYSKIKGTAGKHELFEVRLGSATAAMAHIAKYRGNPRHIGSGKSYKVVRVG